ncbi:MAG: hypothetical protein QM680_03560 [Luteolibacter sp.]
MNADGRRDFTKLEDLFYLRPSCLSVVKEIFQTASKRRGNYMKRFREVSGSTARRIDRIMMGMSSLDDFGDLERLFLAESEKLLPADCICWNNWSLDWRGLVSQRCNEVGYTKWLDQHQEVFHEVVGYHPMIVGGHLPKSYKQVLRMSDVIRLSEFRKNPLFREIYRHMDSEYQLSHAPVKLEDRRVVLTWNRRAMDFSERDRQMLHYLGRRLNAISLHLEERQRLEGSWKRLCQFVDAKWSAGSVKTLKLKDGLLLAELLGGKSRAEIAKESGIRVDSLDKRLGVIRECLGLENHRQLLRALAELKAN